MPADRQALRATHSHPDHFDPGTLLRFGRDVPIFVPEVERETVLTVHMADRLGEPGFASVHTLAWWSSVEVGPFCVHAMPFFGEQPTNRDVLHPEVRNHGNTYLVDDGARRYALTADSGRDDRGELSTLAHAARSRLGAADILFGGYRTFAKYPIQYLFSSIARYLAFVPRHAWGARQKVMGDADDLLDAAEAFGAARVVPYADGGAPWYWERGLGPRLDDPMAALANPRVDPPPEMVERAARGRSGSAADGEVASPVRVHVLRPGDGLRFLDGRAQRVRRRPFAWPYDGEGEALMLARAEAWPAESRWALDVAPNAMLRAALFPIERLEALGRGPEIRTSRTMTRRSPGSGARSSRPCSGTPRSRARWPSPTRSSRDGRSAMTLGDRGRSASGTSRRRCFGTSHARSVAPILAGPGAGVGLAEWGEVATIRLRRRARAAPPAAPRRFSPDLAPWQSMLRALGRRREYVFRARWVVNPTLREIALNIWSFWARGAEGACRRRRLRTGLIASEALRRIQEMPPLPGARLVARLGPAIHAGAAESKEIFLQLARAGALVGGLDLPAEFSTARAALVSVLAELLPNDRAHWRRAITEMDAVLTALEQGYDRLGIEEVLGYLAEAESVLVRLHGALAIAEPLPPARSRVRCDSGLPWAVTLGSGDRARMRAALDSYQGRRVASPSAPLRRARDDAFRTWIGEGRSPFEDKTRAWLTRHGLELDDLAAHVGRCLAQPRGAEATRAEPVPAEAIARCLPDDVCFEGDLARLVRDFAARTVLPEAPESFRREARRELEPMLERHDVVLDAWGLDAGRLERLVTLELAHQHALGELRASDLLLEEVQRSRWSLQALDVVTVVVERASVGLELLAETREAGAAGALAVIAQAHGFEVERRRVFVGDLEDPVHRARLGAARVGECLGHRLEPEGFSVEQVVAKHAADLAQPEVARRVMASALEREHREARERRVRIAYR